MKPLPGESAADFYRRVNAAGITEPQNYQYVPPSTDSTFSTPSGGNITMPSLLPAQDSGYGSGEISNALNSSPTSAPRGPRFYGTDQVAPSAPPAPAFDLGSYLGSKFGASAPRSVTTPLNTSTLNMGQNGSNTNLSSILSALLGGYQAPRNELAKFGKGYQNRIDQNFKQDVAKQEQDATSRGLGNSTIRNALIGGARSREQSASLDLADRLAAARAGLLERQMPTALQSSQLLAQAASYGNGNVTSILKSLGLA